MTTPSGCPPTWYLGSQERSKCPPATDPWRAAPKVRASHSACFSSMPRGSQCSQRPPPRPPLPRREVEPSSPLCQPDAGAPFTAPTQGSRWEAKENNDDDDLTKTDATTCHNFRIRTRLSLQRQLPDAGWGEQQISMMMRSCEKDVWVSPPPLRRSSNGVERSDNTRTRRSRTGLPGTSRGPRVARLLRTGSTGTQNCTSQPDRRGGSLGSFTQRSLVAPQS